MTIKTCKKKIKVSVEKKKQTKQHDMIKKRNVPGGCIRVRDRWVSLTEVTNVDMSVCDQSIL